MGEGAPRNAVCSHGRFAGVLVAGSSIVDRDRGYSRTLAALGPLGSIKLGVQGQKASEQHEGMPITVGAIAEIHELGLGVPERSWLRAWCDAKQDMVLQDSMDALKQVILGKLTRERALAVLCLKWQGDIQQWIAEGNVTPELAQSTIDRKGSSVPLIHTGQLRSAITAIAEKAITLSGSLLD